MVGCEALGVTNVVGEAIGSGNIQFVVNPVSSRISTANAGLAVLQYFMFGFPKEQTLDAKASSGQGCRPSDSRAVDLTATLFFWSVESRRSFARFDR